MQPMVAGPEMSAARWQQAAAASAASAALFLGAQGASAGPFTQSEIASLTYDQIKGTGLANTCPRVEDPSTSTKIRPRQTYTLTGIEGPLASEGGKLTFREQDG